MRSPTQALEVKLRAALEVNTGISARSRCVVFDLLVCAIKLGKSSVRVCGGCPSQSNGRGRHELMVLLDVY